MRIIVAITGASGTVLGKRLTEVLCQSKQEVYLIVSKGAEAVSKAEGQEGLKEVIAKAKAFYRDSDLEAPLASSSYPIDSMVVCPCSMKTLAAVAHGYSDNLISRAAENCLKLGRKLVVVPRDTPLSLVALENMVKLKRAGALILPPVLGFYSKPKKIEDLIDFVVGKVLDCLGVDHQLYRRWGGER